MKFRKYSYPEIIPVFDTLLQTRRLTLKGFVYFYAIKQEMMNLKILSLTLFLVIPFVGFTQLFTGGVQLGLAGSQVAGDTYSGYKKAGIAGGGWINLKLNEHHSIQFEMMYLQKGSRHNPNFRIADYTSFLLQFGYIELPLNYVLDLGNKILISGGPSVGVLAHSKQLLDKMPKNTDNFNRIDVSFNAGIAYELTGKTKISLRTFNSVLPINKTRESIDRWRLFSYGKFNDLLLIGLYRKF